jgi:oligoribonuclease
MAARAKRSKKHLIWVDCEMTGLDPVNDVLLEIATIVTDYDLNVIAVGPELAIKQSEARLKGMDAWNRRTHAKSGLIERVRSEGVAAAEAERQTLAFVKKYCYAGTAPLAGNSVGHDKRFLARYMPDFAKFLHYRIVDVSSIKVLVREWYGDKYKVPQKPEVHRAMADIEESIAELRYYREHVFVKD